MKRKVQLIVISHSAPVIINGDARNVVVCEEHDGVIGYRTGPINGEETKHAIARVLDGGERYLKMRLNKYDFTVEDHR